MDLTGVSATDRENTGRAVAIQYFGFAADGVGLVIPLDLPLDETASWR
ncbi:hypothetical protein M8Z33_06295 [Streptomyces sp. ZAF1911]|nr:hypothetical protein [Streptomyces sp. ZAF1911]MDD9376286.1 hypothetical protein [Streptomyces sp. ZAF1911]